MADGDGDVKPVNLPALPPDDEQPKTGEKTRTGEGPSPSPTSSQVREAAKPSATKSEWRHLGQADLEIVWLAVGARREVGKAESTVHEGRRGTLSGDVESQKGEQKPGPPHPERWQRHRLHSVWPPRGLPEGLYRMVVTERCKSQWSYYFTATLYNVCIVLQLLLGASMTALASRKNNDTAITILAAANTVNAGIVALLHNSGLPNRKQKDWNEFARVELYITELLDTGIVRVGQSREDAIEKCFETYRTAKATVQANRPAVYAKTEPGLGGLAPAAAMRR